MLNSNDAYERTKRGKAKKDKKDTKYVLKYINKRIKEACKQGRNYILLDNMVIAENYFLCDSYCCYIDRLPKVTDTLYAKGYSIDRFERYPTDRIKISWENKKVL